MSINRIILLSGLNCLRCFPHVIVFILSKNKFISSDIQRWLEALGLHNKIRSRISGLVYLLTFKPAFRNVFYYRLKHSALLDILCPGVKSMQIAVDYIGEGLYISTGFGSVIGAKYIGKRCTVYQNVTLGVLNGFPTILDNVTIYPGAVVFGPITIGNNVKIGANATVFMDVPDNCTVLPGSSKVMKWKN